MCNIVFVCCWRQTSAGGLVEMYMWNTQMICSFCLPSSSNIRTYIIWIRTLQVDKNFLLNASIHCWLLRDWAGTSRYVSVVGRIVHTRAIMTSRPTIRVESHVVIIYRYCDSNVPINIVMLTCTLHVTLWCYVMSIFSERAHKRVRATVVMASPCVSCTSAIEEISKCRTLPTTSSAAQ